MIEMYVEQELPATVIAKEFGSTFKTVYRVLKRNNVTPRTKSRSQELRHARSNHE